MPVHPIPTPSPTPDGGIAPARYRVVSDGIILGMAMTLRLSEQQTALLREAAARDGLSMQAAALKAVDDYINRRTARRDALLAQILTEDAEVLRRLADT
jgi:hypothetical protein